MCHRCSFTYTLCFIIILILITVFAVVAVDRSSVCGCSAVCDVRVDIDLSLCCHLLPKPFKHKVRRFVRSRLQNDTSDHNLMRPIPYLLVIWSLWALLWACSSCSYNIQRNRYHLFPVGRGCWSSLCGTKPTSVTVKPPLYLAFFLFPDTHHFFRALWTGIRRLSDWPAEDRGKEQNEDNGYFHCVTALCLEEKQAGLSNTVTTCFFSTIKQEGTTFVDEECVTPKYSWGSHNFTVQHNDMSASVPMSINPPPLRFLPKTGDSLNPMTRALSEALVCHWKSLITGINDWFIFPTSLSWYN